MTLRRTTRGATALEFALIFPVLFMMLYGIVVYAYVYTLQQAITYAAQHAAEAVVSINPRPSESYDTRARDAARDAVRRQLAWLPDRQRERALGPTGDKIRVMFMPTDTGSAVRVGVDFDLDGLFPAIALPGIGAVPPLPKTLTAEATARV